MSKGDDRGETGGNDDEGRIVRDGAGAVLAALHSRSRSVQRSRKQHEELSRTCEEEGALPVAVAVPDDEPDDAEMLVTLAILDDAEAEISETLRRKQCTHQLALSGHNEERIGCTGRKQPSSMTR